ncbi:MAG: hypothetical protein KBC06_01000 [Candidatus Pacebacteria bacterium]|nr:hypothetical protein [Candidatus Paceibacterota bacterium]
MRLKYLFLLCLIALLPLGAFSVLAVSPSSINMDVAPSNPTPNQNVTLTLSSYAANLDSVSISWFVNGKSELTGIGKKTFSVTAGASGSRTTVVAKIALPDGEIDKTVVIAPSVMVLLWEATDSYVPPFYRGKALLPSESEVKIVALPEIKTSGGLVNSKNMTYAWKKDYTNVADAGGYAKNSYTFGTDYLDDTNNVSVVASTVDQKYSTEANINVTSITPRISIYKKDQNLGTIWENALTDPYIITGSETLLAAPYFMSPKEIRRPDLTFSWFINDLAVSISSGFQKNILPIKVPEGSSGTSKLKIQVENTDKLLQSVSREIRVQF